MIDDTLFEAEEKMEKAVVVAKEEFGTIRTGRAHPSMFAVLDGHVVPEVERVVSAADRFVVVEKIGAGRTYAAEHDPRSNSSA